MLAQGGSMINELLSLRGGKALVFDEQFSGEIHKFSIPSHAIPEFTSITTKPKRPLDDLPRAEDDDIAMIFHTSGTTSGRPKPVPETHRWLKCQADVNWPGAWQGGDGTQDTFNALGSFAHAGSATGK